VIPPQEGILLVERKGYRDHEENEPIASPPKHFHAMTELRRQIATVGPGVSRAGASTDFGFQTLYENL
jgi:hypothetical protein